MLANGVSHQEPLRQVLAQVADSPDVRPGHERGAAGPVHEAPTMMPTNLSLVQPARSLPSKNHFLVSV